MKRIAFFGPLPPSRTGIADYDDALIPLLRQHFDIDVFAPEPSSVPQTYAPAEFGLRNNSRPYDLSLYQMGNSRFHEYMYNSIFQNPGAVVFHDTCLHHSRADILLKKGMFHEYREELRHVYPEQADRIANAVITFAAGDLLFYQFPLYELLVRSALAAAAHTDHSKETLSVCETPVVKIPHLELPAGAFSKDDLLPGKLVIASFGLATAAKRNNAVLEVLSKLKPQHPELVYLIAGDVEDHAGLNARISALRLQQNVHTTGRLDMNAFLRWMHRADIIVNLRYPSAGEMSGTLIRAMAGSKPVIISRLPHLLEIPEDCVLRVRPDHEHKELMTALNRLVESVNLRQALSEKARHYIETRHSPKQAVNQYLELIDIALQRKTGYRPPMLPLHLRSGT